MMKTTFTLDRLEIEELIRQKLSQAPHAKFNQSTEKLVFNFGDAFPMQQSVVCTVEIERLPQTSAYDRDR
jgi:hypothetical protein